MVDIRNLSDEELARFTRTLPDEYELVRNTARLVLRERYRDLLKNLKKDRPRRKRLDTNELRKRIEKEIDVKIKMIDPPPDNDPLDLNYEDLSDEELLWQYKKKGDDDAFANLFERHRENFLKRWRTLDEAFFGRHEEELTECVRVAFQSAARSKDAFADSEKGCMPYVRGLVGASFWGFMKGLEDGELVLLCRMRATAANLNYPEARRVPEDAWDVLHKKHAHISNYWIGRWGGIACLHMAARAPENIYNEALLRALKPNAYNPEAKNKKGKKVKFQNYLLMLVKRALIDIRRSQTTQKAKKVQLEYQDMAKLLGGLFVKSKGVEKGKNRHMFQERSSANASEFSGSPLDNLMRQEVQQKLRETLARESAECQDLLDMQYFSQTTWKWADRKREMVKLGHGERTVGALQDLSLANRKRMLKYLRKRP
jgi:hypothetical protein